MQQEQIIINCSDCHKQLRIPSDKRIRFKCPQCGLTMNVNHGHIIDDGGFSSSASKVIDERSKILYETAMVIANILENNNAKLTHTAKIEISKFDTQIIDLIKFCERHESTVSTVQLNGQIMPIRAMFMVILRIAKDIEESTGYRFAFRKLS